MAKRQKKVISLSFSDTITFILLALTVVLYLSAIIQTYMVSVQTYLAAGNALDVADEEARGIVLKLLGVSFVITVIIFFILKNIFEK